MKNLYSSRTLTLLILSLTVNFVVAQGKINAKTFTLKKSISYEDNGLDSVEKSTEYSATQSSTNIDNHNRVSNKNEYDDKEALKSFQHGTALAVLFIVLGGTIYGIVRYFRSYYKSRFTSRDSSTEARNSAVFHRLPSSVALMPGGIVIGNANLHITPNQSDDLSSERNIGNFRQTSQGRNIYCGSPPPPYFPTEANMQ